MAFGNLGPYRQESAVKRAFLIAQRVCKIKDIKLKNAPGYLLNDSRGLSATLRRKPNRVGKRNWVAVVSVNGAVPQSGVDLRNLQSSDEIHLLGVKYVADLKAAQKHDADVIDVWRRRHAGKGLPHGVIKKHRVNGTRKVNWAEKDFKNRTLGKRGESFILELEKRRLQAVGRVDLAKKVRWISEEDGDGLGYDIRSFEENGDTRFIEVKTTNRNETTPFYITQKELECSREKTDHYYLYRVHDFASNPRQFCLCGPLLESTLLLECRVYRATVQTAICK